MSVEGRVAVVTGGAGGIGRALVLELRRRGAAHVAVVDRNMAGADAVASEVGGSAWQCDVGREADVRGVVELVGASAGPVGLFCSNAGVLERDPDVEDPTSASEEAWERSWRVNVMAHVYAARACLPGMRERGEGWFLQTVSAAGLLSQIGAAAYSTTKHAALGFAESLAIAVREHGVGVSALCPQAVGTAMVEGREMWGADVDGVATPEHVAACAIDGVEAGRFMILPHPQAAGYVLGKAQDHDRWIDGMARLRGRLS
ncbi:short-chain dehydrogenase [Sphingomonas lenta]|uniref:Short-chain dehydrogenase n=1 Tax=Sphingomonas lenta TaxID=1141887 RepID=A0A2A2SGF3_9SPHN|nr:short-chain dehydrogenase [Sphingomonas lenta]